MSFIDDNALLLLENLPEALVVTEPGGTIIYFNKSAESLTEYTAAEVLGKNVTLLIPHQARQRVNVVEWLDRWARHPNPAQLHFLHLTGKTRSGIELRYSVRVASFESTQAPCFAIVFRDVSQELQTQAELKHAHLLTRRILAISEDAVLTVDDHQHIQFWNLKAEQTFGYTADEIVGQPLDVLLPDSVRAIHQNHVAAFTAGKTASRMMGDRGEIRGIHKDGHNIPLEASITKTVIDGKMVLSAHLRDITDRKRSEKKLTESELRFRAIFDHALEAMVLLTPEGQIVEINNAACLLLGAETGTQEFPYKYFWDLDWWPEITDQQELQAAQQDLRSNVQRATTGEPVRAQVALRMPSGQQRQIDFSVLPVTGADGEVTYIIVEGRDITPFVSS